MAQDLKSSSVITTTALDADGLSTAAAVGNNAALTLGGALTSGEHIQQILEQLDQLLF